jgi:hypothetical protein
LRRAAILLGTTSFIADPVGVLAALAHATSVQCLSHKTHSPPTPQAQQIRCSCVLLQSSATPAWCAHALPMHIDMGADPRACAT